MTEIRIELLIGRKVHDVDGETIGRIQDIRGEQRDKDFLVEAYLVGASALVERLAAWSLIRPIRRLLPGSLYSMYRIPWNEMDLTDRQHPRLTVTKSQLRRVSL